MAVPELRPTFTPISTFEEWRFERVGSLMNGMSVEDVIAQIGYPKTKGPCSEPDESDFVYQLWSYDDQGIFINFSMIDGYPNTARIYNFLITVPYEGFTSSGIGLYDDVNYANGILSDAYGMDHCENVDNVFSVGTEHFGIKVFYDHDLVCGIGVGSFADCPLPLEKCANLSPIYNTKPRFYVGMTGKQVMDIAGKPDEVYPSADDDESWYMPHYNFVMHITNSPKGRNEYTLLEFEDQLFMDENLGWLHLGLSEKKCASILGKPESKGKKQYHESDYGDSES